MFSLWWPLVWWQSYSNLIHGLANNASVKCTVIEFSFVFTWCNCHAFLSSALVHCVDLSTNSYPNGCFIKALLWPEQGRWQGVWNVMWVLMSTVLLTIQKPTFHQIVPLIYDWQWMFLFLCWVYLKINKWISHIVVSIYIYIYIWCYCLTSLAL
jgi:hypothetical protein